MIDVIIPTLASADRFLSLKSAINSIRTSSAFPIEIIVVVNGSRYDVEVCDWLKHQADVRYEYVEAASAPGALLRGRELVHSMYFSTLDDDDEFLRDAIDLKLNILKGNPSVDLVVSNGYRNIAGHDDLLYEQLPRVLDDPLLALMNFPWLNGDNALYRTASIDVDFFRDYHPHAIWTWLAYKLMIAGKSVDIIDAPGCRIHDTAASVSKSDSYAKALVPLFKRMLELKPSVQIGRLVRRKLGAAYHEAAGRSLADGRRKEAWINHWHSLKQIGGMRYLLYTRRLLR